MKLSVIIVNYNVRHFLKQCLTSVIKASENIETEIIVVDNNSADGSVEMVKKEFPSVKIIANKQNLGFSKANNQAIKQAKGEYILLLNPDTFVEENTFSLTLDYMENHPDVGGLGVKMINGNGDFLPESKRGLPTPMVAFYKLSGLSKIFPKSKTFNKYYLGHLDINEINEVEILSGAFMLIRKSVLDKIGLLDETFFMYGEDIDLSYRILKAGYKNVYFPKTKIVHYKGESTKKGSLNYVVTFYKAMKIFVDKHFASKGNALIFKTIINLAIVFRALFAMFSRFLRKIFLPLVDFSIIYAGYLFLLVPYWEKLHLKSSYPDTYLYVILPVYTFIWIFTLFLSGSYDSPISIKNTAKGTIIGSILILIFYSLLSEDLRYSRALILLGTIWVFATTILVRILLWKLKVDDYKIAEYTRKRVAVVGKKEEFEKIKALLKSLNLPVDFLGFISIDSNDTEVKEYIGNASRISEIIKMNKINEVIFSAKSLSSEEIIRLMTDLSNQGIEFKVASPDGLSVIGSSSVNTNGEIYVVSFNSINSAKNKRLKRLFDIVTSLIILIFSPLFVFFQKDKGKFLNNIFSVLTGKKSWIGFYVVENKNPDYARIKPGVFTPIDKKILKSLSPDAIEKINLNYAQNYSVFNDFIILLNNLTKLDGNE
jgi:GT2 family glycosyltransferase